jgi:hypothetical protein
MLGNFTNAFRENAYVRDMGMYLFYGSPDYCIAQAIKEGFSLLEVIGFRGHIISSSISIFHHTYIMYSENRKPVFSYSLTADEKKGILEYLVSQDYWVAEQHPEWPAITGNNSKICFFILTENNRIVSYALIYENRGFLKTAEIRFGPVCNDSFLIVDSVRIIDSFYRQQNFSRLTIQLAMRTGSEADFIEYRLNSELNIKYRFDTNNWSSIELDLTAPEGELYKNFSKGLKYSLKKSVKLGLTTVKMPLNGKDLLDLGNIYNSMRKKRGFRIDDRHIHELLSRLNVFLLSSNKGDIFIVKDNSGNVTGGIVTLYQGKSVRFYLGASDPSKRDLPVLHTALWEAVKDSREKGFMFFDFWGYNHMVDENNQIYQINKFKKSFGGRFIFFPKIMYLNYRPLMLFIYDCMIAARGYFRKNG